MVVFFDTNVVLDYFLDRDGFAEDARLLLRKCYDEKLTGYISSNTIADVFYITRKQFSAKARRAKLYDLCEFVKAVGLEHENVISAIENEKFADLEDCLQSECAEKIAAKYIITRNVKDFANSKIPAITPSDFLRL